MKFQAWRKRGLGFLVVFCGVLAFGTALAADTVKIGMLYSVTGAGSSLGPIQMRSAKLAVKEKNDAGGVKIGQGARIGANAVVLSDVPDGATAFAPPVRCLLGKPAVAPLA